MHLCVNEMTETKGVKLTYVLLDQVQCRKKKY